jgi:uncharacterized membrane protein YdjX (TVP38/TMEM64 family)
MKRATLISIWLLLLATSCIVYYRYPEYFTIQALADFFLRFKNQLLILYFLASALRGIVLLPSTPFVIAGLVLFPNDLWFVLGISLSGIFASSAIIYFFSQHLALDKIFDTRFRSKTNKIRAKINSSYGIAFVMAWSFFPIVPTDLICYVAGTVRMNFKKFIISILIGEGLICSIYIFAGEAFFSWLNGIMQLKSCQ